MKFVSIALFMFILQVSISIVNGLGILPTAQVTPNTAWFGQVNQSATYDEDYFQNTVESEASVSFGFGDFVKGLWFFIKSVFWCLVSVPYTLRIFGVPGLYAYLFSLPVYFLYFIGIAQFVANRNMEGQT